jgi:hypothetical protein
MRESSDRRWAMPEGTEVGKERATEAAKTEKEISKKTLGELSEEELKEIAGGATKKKPPAGC